MVCLFSIGGNWGACGACLTKVLTSKEVNIFKKSEKYIIVWKQRWFLLQAILSLHITVSWRSPGCPKSCSLNLFFQAFPDLSIEFSLPLHRCQNTLWAVGNVWLVDCSTDRFWKLKRHKRRYMLVCMEPPGEACYNYRVLGSRDNFFIGTVVKPRNMHLKCASPVILI